MIINRIFKVSSLFIFCFLLSCGENEVKEEVVLRPVRYSEVGYVGGDKSRSFSGTAKTEKIINLSFRSSGIVTKLDMKLGQKVRKNDLLGTLDNVSARLNYESAIESKNSSESQMNTAKLALNRVRTLYEKGSSSLSDYEDAKNSYRTAVASFESSKRSVAIQQDQIRFGYLYAPEDGVIASVSAEVDENVSPGQTIGVLNAGSAIEISLGLPESVINAVKKDMKVRVSFTAIPEENFNAVVTEVAPAVDQNTSTYPVTVMVTDRDDRIKSGMAASVNFEFVSESLDKKTMVVPANAVGEDGNGRFVFIIEESDEMTTVNKQPITIGNLTPEGFEVVSGLQIGQKIATAGLQTLLDGQEVKLN
ncbi:efflux RND transporter periplasmic adaptor subunit [Winogradskyella sp. KYW1333]|jgi:RND family efflux transporter MFP subunit|uniref:efflux RND transporter periplasmic adaptor subunit n=1 Tax=Winogradskyella sp. KYW1333 TaxID=2282123 RepID=UPI000DF2FECB|nr:efflux RND transporter periplasmic adaptor subunit [Winogradskyella sp. KYW1333]RCT55052.1 efflux RND transporter periplasmic adaptor subunit [Winogradskyella sp. KYW1333]